MKIPSELIKRQQEAFEEALNMYKKSKYKSNSEDVVRENTKEYINTPENLELVEKDTKILEEMKIEINKEIVENNKDNKDIEDIEDIKDIIILEEDRKIEKTETKIYENKKNKKKKNIQNNYSKINNISGLHYSMLTPCIQKNENNKKK